MAFSLWLLCRRFFFSSAPLHKSAIVFYVSLNVEPENVSAAFRLPRSCTLRPS